MPKDKNIVRCPSCGCVHPDYDGTDYCETCEPPSYAGGAKIKKLDRYEPTETDRMTDA